MSLLSCLLESDLKLGFHLEGCTFIFPRPRTPERTVSHCSGWVWRPAQTVGSYTESLRLCILDQFRLLTMYCCSSHSLSLSLSQPDPDPWWKGLKPLERKAWELCVLLHYYQLSPTHPKFNTLVIFGFRCRVLAWNMPLFIPCNGSLDVRWVERISVSPQTSTVGKFLLT